MPLRHPVPSTHPVPPTALYRPLSCTAPSPCTAHVLQVRLAGLPLSEHLLEGVSASYGPKQPNAASYDVASLLQWAGWQVGWRGKVGGGQVGGREGGEEYCLQMGRIWRRHVGKEGGRGTPLRPFLYIPTLAHISPPPPFSPPSAPASLPPSPPPLNPPSFSPPSALACTSTLPLPPPVQGPGSSFKAASTAMTKQGGAESSAARSEVYVPLDHELPHTCVLALDFRCGESVGWGEGGGFWGGRGGEWEREEERKGGEEVGVGERGREGGRKGEEVGVKKGRNEGLGAICVALTTHGPNIRGVAVPCHHISWVFAIQEHCIENGMGVGATCLLKLFVPPHPTPLHTQCTHGDAPGCMS